MCTRISVRQPQRSTRFPYTTLFRSSALMAAPASGISLEDKKEATGLLLRAGADITALNCVRKHLSDIKGDRKSTRLNSSHLVISYAVFCLKKTKHRSNRAERQAYAQ